MRRRIALIVVALVAASAWAGLTQAGVAHADDVQAVDTTSFVVVAQPDGFSDGSDNTVATAPTGFSDGTDVPTPDGFSDGTDGVVLDVPSAAIVAD